MDDRIRTFRVTGKVYLWRYGDATAGYKGIHLTADNKGCQELLTLLDLMKDSKYSSKHQLALTPPTGNQTDVPSRSYSKIQPYSSLQLNHQKQYVDHWRITYKDEGLVIEFGKNHLNQLINAIAAINDGKGDFTISDENADDENTLWFWWNLEK